MEEGGSAGGWRRERGREGGSMGGREREVVWVEGCPGV